MNQEVTMYINQIDQEWQVEICSQIRQVIHQSIPDVKEEVKYKQAFYTLKGKQVCVFFPAKNWINLTFFQAETLDAPEGYFESSGKADRKTTKIRKEEQLKGDLLAKLLHQVTQNID